MKLLFVLLFLSFTSSHVLAQSQVTYDLSGSSGTREGSNYSEIHLGLNWFLNDNFNWRNSVFTQFGTNIKTVNGLDSAALLNYQAYTQSRKLGLEFYVGPGVRLATEKSNAAFAKAGLTFALGGLRVGGGVQALHYLEDRMDADGKLLNKDEVQTFIVLSGGGNL